MWLAELEEQAGEHADRHAERLTSDVELHITTRWTRADQVTSGAWLAARRELHQPEKEGGAGLSWRSIAHVAHTLRSLLRWCAAQGALDSVPEIASPPQKLVEKEQAFRRAMTAVERGRFLKALERAQAWRAWRIYSVLFFTALRQGELAALTLRWVDFKRQALVIPATDSKSGTAEEVWLHPRAARAIKGELRARGSIEPDAPVFGGFDCRKAFRKALEKAKIDPKGLTAHHTARHTACTLAAEQTDDVRTLQAVGRWKSLAMVQKYFHADGRRSKAALRRI